MLVLGLLLAAAFFWTISEHALATYREKLEQSEAEWFRHLEKRFDRHFVFLSPGLLRRIAQGIALVGILTALTTLSWIPFLSAATFLLLPPFLLRQIGSRRRKLFARQLEASLPQISSILHAGHSFERALASLAERGRPPLSQEIALVLREVRIGTPLPEALENLLKRFPSRDLEIAIRAVEISRRVGSNLAEALDRVAETLRERSSLRDRLLALTAQARAQAAIALLMPILTAIALDFIAPGHLDPLFFEPLGRVALLTALLGMTTGAFWIYRIGRSETT